MAYSSDIRVVEENIISLLKKKDQRGIELFYDRYSNVIYGFLYRVLQSDELAEEALIEVCMRVWRTIETFDSEKERLFTWTINIARQQAVSKLKNSAFAGIEKNDDYLSNFHYNPESIGARDIIKNLDDNQQLIIEGIYFFGYDYKKMAEKLNISLHDLKINIRSVLKIINNTQPVTK